MTAVGALEELETLGSAQWGLVTTAQAQRAGVSRVVLGRLVERGSVRRVRHGVYALPSAGFGALQDVRAAWLATDAGRDVEQRVSGGGDVVVSHVSAAVVHGLGDLVASRHEFTAPIRRQTSQPDVRFHKGVVSGRDRLLVDGLPVTSVVRTVVDLAVSHLDFDHLASVVRDGLQVAGGTYAQLAERLDPYARRYGYDTGATLVEGCLATAGLPDTAADVLSQSLGPVVVEVTKGLKPLLAEMAKQWEPVVAEVARLNSQTWANVARAGMPPGVVSGVQEAVRRAMPSITVDPPRIEIPPGVMSAVQEASRRAVSPSAKALGSSPGTTSVRSRGEPETHDREDVVEGSGDVGGEGDEGD